MAFSRPPSPVRSCSAGTEPAKNIDTARSLSALRPQAYRILHYSSSLLTTSSLHPLRYPLEYLYHGGRCPDVCSPTTTTQPITVLLSPWRPRRDLRRRRLCPSASRTVAMLLPRSSAAAAASTASSSRRMAPSSSRSKRTSTPPRSSARYVYSLSDVIPCALSLPLPLPLPRALASISLAEAWLWMWSWWVVWSSGVAAPKRRVKLHSIPAPTRPTHQGFLAASMSQIYCFFSCPVSYLHSFPCFTVVASCPTPNTDTARVIVAQSRQIHPTHALTTCLRVRCNPNSPCPPLYRPYLLDTRHTWQMPNETA